MADFMACGVRRDPAECVGAIRTSLATPPTLGLVEFRWGDEQLLHFQPSWKLRFFLCMVIINLPGLWRGYDPSECTGAFDTPWATLNLLGLVEFHRGDEKLRRLHDGWACRSKLNPTINWAMEAGL